MRYSVIIPYKDIVDLVVRAVQSVPDRPDIEVIIINNGTTELPASLFAGRHNVQVLWDAIGKGAGADHPAWSESFAAHRPWFAK